MKTVSKYITSRAGIFFFAVVLMIMQAWCDLALPSYTSAIVDTGISAGGVEEDLPLVLSAMDYSALEREAGRLASDSYKPLTEDHPDYDKLKDKYPLIEGAYYLDGDGEGLEEIISELYLASGRILRYKSPVKSYIIDCYENLGRTATSVQMGYIIKTGGRMMAMVLMSISAAIATAYVSSVAGAGISRDLRHDVYSRVLSFSPTEFDRFSTASLITRSTNDIQQLQMMVIMSMRMVSYAPIMAVGGIIKVAQTAPSMWWVIAMAVAAIIVVMTVLFKVTMPRFTLQQKLIDKLNLVSREVLNGLTVIRAFGSEKRETDRFEKANDDLMKTGLFLNRTMSLMNPIITLIMNGCTLVIVWVGAGHIADGTLQVGDMMAFITYAMNVIMSFLMLGMMSISAPRALVSVRRIAEVLETESSVADPEKAVHGKPELEGQVEFDHVDFSYPGADEKVLSDISFTARAGETTAIIGSTGCGKTTLVSLIPRFFDVTGGHVYVEGVDVRDMTQRELRDKIGFVPQKSVLFSGTIGSNIAFSDPSMSRDEIMDAAETAQASEFISARPEGLEAPIAQGGSNVSGGQKQRLAIARALAKKAPIYIFDDSFSALDYKTDRALRHALNSRMENSAVIIVAQRISTVLNADKIIVLEDGRMVGMGNHKELMKTCEEYRQIALSQLSKEELANG